MYEQDIRAHVLDSDLNWSPEFESWAELTLKGAYELKQESVKWSVWFELEEDAIAYNLTWCESVYTHPKVIIPLLRRVIPTIIAYDILGVSPLTAPAKWSTIPKDPGTDV